MHYSIYDTTVAMSLQESERTETVNEASFDDGDHRYFALLLQEIGCEIWYVIDGVELSGYEDRVRRFGDEVQARSAFEEAVSEAPKGQPA